MNTIVIAYDQRDVRGPIRTRLKALWLFVVGMFLAVLTLPLLVLGPRRAGRRCCRTAGGRRPRVLVNAVYWPLVLVLLLLALTSFYHVTLPHRLPWRRHLPGTVLARRLLPGRRARAAGLRRRHPDHGAALRRAGRPDRACCCSASSSAWRCCSAPSSTPPSRPAGRRRCAGTTRRRGRRAAKLARAARNSRPGGTHSPAALGHVCGEQAGQLLLAAARRSPCRPGTPGCRASGLFVTGKTSPQRASTIVPMTALSAILFLRDVVEDLVGAAGVGVADVRAARGCRNCSCAPWSISRGAPVGRTAAPPSMMTGCSPPPPRSRPPAGTVLSPEVADALAAGRPVVALESTLLAHGLPRPDNRAAADEVEAAVRAGGAVPATIAVLDGVPHVGLTAEQVDRVCADPGPGQARRPRPAGRRGTGPQRRDDRLQHRAAGRRAPGIGVFATGGLGGVHRHAADTFDESADLTALSRTSLVVVCAGVKSILDVPATLERLESLSVTVVGYRTTTFPGFYVADSGSALDWSVDDPAQAAAVFAARRELAPGAVVVANPLPRGRAARPGAARPGDRRRPGRRGAGRGARQGRHPVRAGPPAPRQRAARPWRSTCGSCCATPSWPAGSPPRWRTRAR